jgi:hypothetical protein
MLQDMMQRHASTLLRSEVQAAGQERSNGKVYEEVFGPFDSGDATNAANPSVASNQNNSDAASTSSPRGTLVNPQPPDSPNSSINSAIVVPNGSVPNGSVPVVQVNITANGTLANPAPNISVSGQSANLSGGDGPNLTVATQATDASSSVVNSTGANSTISAPGATLNGTDSPNLTIATPATDASGIVVNSTGANSTISAPGATLNGTDGPNLTVASPGSAATATGVLNGTATLPTVNASNLAPVVDNSTYTPDATKNSSGSWFDWVFGDESDANNLTRDNSGIQPNGSADLNFTARNDMPANTSGIPIDLNDTADRDDTAARPAINASLNSTGAGDKVDSCAEAPQLRQCSGLVLFPGLATWQECREACCQDLVCTVWQFSGPSFPNECWMGRFNGTNCLGDSIWAFGCRMVERIGEGTPGQNSGINGSRMVDANADKTPDQIWNDIIRGGRDANKIGAHNARTSMGENILHSIGSKIREELVT